MTKSLRHQFSDTLRELGKADEKLIVMVGDISHGILKPFAEENPDRYYNIGILEPTMISMGAGLSAVGLHPVVHTIAPFLIERSFEQIKLDFCYHQLGGNIVTVGSAFDYSNLGCTHHCYGDFALLKTLQNTEICFPASAIEFDQLFRQSYTNDFLTVYRLAGHPHSFEFSPSDIVFGQGIIVHDGKDVTIVATGPHLDTALNARQQLVDDGVSVEVIYIHTIRPLDINLIRSSVKKTGRVIVIEEHMKSGGLGDDILRATYDIGSIKFHSVSIPDTFVKSYGTYEELTKEVGLTSDAIIKISSSWLSN